MSISKKLFEELKENPWSDELSSDFEVFEDGDWTDEGKTEGKVDVIKHLPSGKFYEAFFTRSGDHWQGYETDVDAVREVTPKLVEHIVYVEVQA